MVKDKDISLEGDSLLFEDDKDKNTKIKENIEDKDSNKVSSESKHSSAKSDKSKDSKGKVKKMSNNDDFVIRIKKPGKLFIERLAWIIVIAVLLIFVFKGGACDANGGMLDGNSSEDVSEATEAPSEDVEEEAEPEAEEDVITEAEQKLADEIMDKITEDAEVEATCDEDDLKIAFSAISSNDKELTKISIRITTGDEDLEGYGLYLGARVPDTSSFIKIVPSADKNGIKYFTSTLKKCTTKALSFSTFSPKYYSDNDETTFKIQLYDSDGDKLDYATKDHDFS